MWTPKGDGLSRSHGVLRRNPYGPWKPRRGLAPEENEPCPFTSSREWPEKIGLESVFESRFQLGHKSGRQIDYRLGHQLGPQKKRNWFYHFKLKFLKQSKKYIPKYLTFRFMFLKLNPLPLHQEICTHFLTPLCCCCGSFYNVWWEISLIRKYLSELNWRV